MPRFFSESPAEVYTQAGDVGEACWAIGLGLNDRKRFADDDF